MTNIKGIYWKQLSEALGIGDPDNLNALFLNTMDRLGFKEGEDYIRITIDDPTTPRDKKENILFYNTALTVIKEGYSDNKDQLIKDLEARKSEFVAE